MKKGFLLTLLGIIVVFTVFGQDVDREELEKNIPEVEFINYQGPYNIIESKAEIMSIGTSLGEIISGGQERASIAEKYWVLHLVDPTEPDKLGADIIFLGENSQVDHIRNLRFIITAYLQEVYNLEEEEAFILARFTTFYNAVYRGNIGFFEERYINKVSTSISAENAGIDVHYSNWPGKTALVIPLTPFGGDEDQSVTPDPFELTDEKVIEDLKEEKDMGLDDRKQITELQEEKVEQEKKAVEEKEKQVAEKEEAVKEKEKEIEEKEKEIEEKKKEIEEKVEKGEITEKEAEKEQEQLEEEKEVVEKEKEVVEEKKEVVAEERKEVEEGKKEIEKKEEKISDSREEITKDQNTVLENETEKTESTSVALDTDLAFPLITGEVAKFVFFNPNDKTITEPADSPVIGSRVFVETASAFVIPAQDSNGKFVLTAVSSKDLTIIEQGAEEVYPSTSLLKDGNFIYCVVKSSDKWVIAKYSENLEVEVFSSVEANPATFIVKNGNTLLYQDKSGGIVSVNSNSLI